MSSKVKILSADTIAVGQNTPKQLTKETTITSNRTVVGLQITINYTGNEYDVVTFLKKEMKEFTNTLFTLKNMVEELRK